MGSISLAMRKRWYVFVRQQCGNNCKEERVLTKPGWCGIVDSGVSCCGAVLSTMVLESGLVLRVVVRLRRKQC